MNEYIMQTLLEFLKVILELPFLLVSGETIVPGKNFLFLTRLVWYAVDAWKVSLLFTGGMPELLNPISHGGKGAIMTTEFVDRI